MKVMHIKKVGSEAALSLNFLRVISILCILAALIMCYRFLKVDNTYAFDLRYLETNPDSMVVNCFNLRAGSFELIIDYETGADVTGYVQADNDKAFDVPLAAGQNTVTVPFSLAHPTDRFKITIPIDEGNSDIRIEAIRLRSGRFPIYTDSLMYALIFILLAAAAFMISRKWGELTPADKYTFLVLLALIVLVNIPYYQRALGFTADIRAHMQRIEGIMRGLTDRQFPVVISPNMMNEFGEMTFLYPDIFLYPFGIMRIVGVSMLTAYRLCMLCVNALTVILAYISFNLMCKDRVTVLIATFIITFEPYRLYNMLARGSGAGNAIASAFLPLVIAGIYLILKADKRWWILSVGMTGVIQSHVLTLIILVGVLIVLGVVFAGSMIKEGRIILLLKAIWLAILMNLGFLVIFIKCYLTDWSSAALEWSDFTESAFGIREALTDPWSVFEIVSMGICIYLLIRTERKSDMEFKLSLALTVIGGALYITSLKIFPWDILISGFPSVDRLTKMLQVPNRVYAVSSVLFICAMIISLGKVSKRHILIGGLLLGTIIYGTVTAFADYYSAGALMPDEVYGDHNSLPVRDYIPTGVTDDTWANDAGFVSDEDAVESLSYQKSGTHIDYVYISNEEGTYANMPLLYYEWYRAEDEKGEAVNVRRSDDGRVIADLKGDGIQHEVHIYFDMGRGYSLLYALSLVLSIIVIIRLVSGRKHNREDVET